MYSIHDDIINNKYPLERSGSMIKTKNKVDKLCINCSVELSNPRSTYCSNQCQRDYDYSNYITQWKLGKIDGSISHGDEISRFIRRYIMNKFNSACSLCKYDKVNPFSNKPVVEIEHINGDPSDNNESNLTVLCPNCHSLTATYRALNKGHGRKHRRTMPNR